MKVFQKLAGLCLGLTLCFGLCALAACEKESTESSSSTPPVESSSPVEDNETVEAYVFTVLDKDGNPVKDYRVLLCLSGDSGVCLAPVSTDEDGKAIVDPTQYGQQAAVYDIHVMSATSTDHLEFEGESQTAATYGEYTLKLKA